MKELSLHILDIIENSISAKATNIKIVIDENIDDDILTIIVEDNGKGMDEEMVANVIDPFITSRTTRKVGLGIPLFKASAESCNGSFTINSQVGGGTKIETNFQYSHIDRMPLGNIGETIHSLLITSPEIIWEFLYRKNSEEFSLNSSEVMSYLGDDLSISNPHVIKFLREFINEGISSLN